MLSLCLFVCTVCVVSEHATQTLALILVLFLFCFFLLLPVWLTTQNHSTLVTERSAVPFLPVNPEYSATRNQVRPNTDPH